MAINTMQFRMAGLIAALEKSTGKSVERVGADDDGYIKVFFKDGTSAGRDQISKLVGEKW